MNHEQIEGFAAVFDAVPRLTEIEIRHEGTTLRLRRAQRLASPIPAPRPTPAPTPANTAKPAGLLTITAQHVGVFHELGGKPIAKGDLVKPGQVLGHIETMRVMNDCITPQAGQIETVLVQDGQPVEYGQPLIEVQLEGS